MILKNPNNQQEINQEPDVTPANLETLKSWIKEQVAANPNGVDVLDLMKARREDKSGERFWQCFTDEMWLDVAKEIEAEYAAMNVDVSEEEV